MSRGDIVDLNLWSFVASLGAIFLMTVGALLCVSSPPAGYCSSRGVYCQEALQVQQVNSREEAAVKL